VPDYLYALDMVMPVVHTSDWPLYYLYDGQAIPPVTMSRLEEERASFVLDGQDIFRMVDGRNLRFVPYVRRADLLARYHHMAGHASLDTMLHLVDLVCGGPIYARMSRIG
jgi:hypothetical protein